MKKFLIPVMILILIGCTSLGIPTHKRRITDELWDEIGRELSRISVKVDSINKQLKSEELVVQVVEPWVETKGLFYELITPSKVEKFPVKKKSVIAIPMVKGAKEFVVFMAMGKEGEFIGVAPKIFNQPYAALKHKFMASGLPVVDYTYALNQPEEINALKQYMSYTSLVDKAYKKIMALLKEVQKKFEESPIYVDGFTVSLGLTFSVDIHFKIK
jgi:hypothetical protein